MKQREITPAKLRHDVYECECCGNEKNATTNHDLGQIYEHCSYCNCQRAFNRTGPAKPHSELKWGSIDKAGPWWKAYKAQEVAAGRWPK